MTQSGIIDTMDTSIQNKYAKRLFRTMLVKLLTELLERILPDALSRVHHQLHEVVHVVLRSTFDPLTHSHSRITPGISWQLKRWCTYPFVKC